MPIKVEYTCDTCGTEASPVPAEVDCDGFVRRSVLVLCDEHRARLRAENRAWLDESGLSAA